MRPELKQHFTHMWASASFVHIWTRLFLNTRTENEKVIAFQCRCMRRPNATLTITHNHKRAHIRNASRYEVLKVINIFSLCTHEYMFGTHAHSYYATHRAQIRRVNKIHFTRAINVTNTNGISHTTPTHTRAHTHTLKHLQHTQCRNNTTTAGRNKRRKRRSRRRNWNTNNKALLNSKTFAFFSVFFFVRRSHSRSRRLLLFIFLYVSTILWCCEIIHDSIKIE